MNILLSYYIYENENYNSIIKKIIYNYARNNKGIFYEYFSIENN